MKTAALFLLLTVTVSLVKGETPLPSITAENPVPTRIRSAVGAEGLVFEFPTVAGDQYQVFSSSDLSTWTPGEVIRSLGERYVIPALAENPQTPPVGQPPFVSVRVRMQKLSSSPSDLLLIWDSLDTPGTIRVHTLKNQILDPDFPERYAQVFGNFRFDLRLDPVSLSAGPGNLALASNDALLINTLQQALVEFNADVANPPITVSQDPALTDVGGEKTFFSIERVNNQFLDWDGDGLGNGIEISLGSDPFRGDTDFDGFNDRTENLSGTNVLVNDLLTDPDRPPASLLSGAVARYDFEQAEIVNGRNSFPNKLAFTNSNLHRLFTAGPTDSAGLASKSLKISNPNHFAEVLGATLLGNEFSISLWFKINANAGMQIQNSAFFGSQINPNVAQNVPPLALLIVFNNSGAGNDGLRLIQRSSLPTITDAVLPFSLDDGNWHHLTLVRNSTRFIAYIDGTLRLQNNSHLANFDPSFLIFGLAQLQAGTTTFLGNFDDIIVHNRPLTFAEIQTLANDSKTDTDGDGVNDVDETAAGLNPLVVDPPGAVAP